MVAPKAIPEQGVTAWARAAIGGVLAAGLAGCGDPPAAGRGVSSAASPPGPVNPDARVTHYACVDGQTITAGYPDSGTAVVTYRDHAYTLKRTPSAGGARYTGYGLQWETRGARARIAPLAPGEEAASAPGLDCTAAPDQPAAGPATRTNSTLPRTDSHRGA